MDASVEKSGLHPRNSHRGRYDFGRLVACCPELALFVAINEYGDESIDFSNPSAVKALNRALLKLEYGIEGWDIRCSIFVRLSPAEQTIFIISQTCWRMVATFHTDHRCGCSTLASGPTASIR
jgi:hypothetical protein